MNRRVPMPSPRGTNAAGLFLPSAGGFALDSAPPMKVGAKAIDAAVRAMCRAGCGDKEIDRFVYLCSEAGQAEGEQAEDDEGKSGYVDGEWCENVQEPRKGKMDGFVDLDGQRARDHLPSYSNNLPLNDLANPKRPGAMDSSPAALRKLMGTVKRGPVY
jgi:hypothetical protein